MSSKLTSRFLTKLQSSKFELFGWLAVIALPWLFAFLFGPVFEVNDDVGNIILFREFFGSGSADSSIFVSTTLTHGMIYLYRALPEVPWYGLALLCSLGSSQLLLLRLIATTISSRLFRVCLVVVVTNVIFYLTLYISFTSSGLLLTSSALLFGSIVPASEKRDYRAIGLALLAFGFLLRPGVFLIAVLLMAPVSVATLLSGRATWQRLLRSWLPHFIVVGSLFIVEWTIESPAKTAFKKENAVRALFSDTSWGNVTEDFQQASFAAGWSAEDYQVVKSLWWFSDEIVHSQDALSNFTMVTQAHDPIPWSVHNLKSHLLSARYGLGLYAVLLCGWLGLLQCYRKPWLWTTVAVGGGCLVLLAGLRFPLRIAYPFLLILSLAPLAGCSKKTLATKDSPNRSSVLVAMLLFFAWSAWSPVKDHRKGRNALDLLQSSVEDAQREIVEENPDALFVPLSLRGFWQGSFHKPLRPFHLHQSLPTGWLGQSPARDSFLEANGFSKEDPLVPQLLSRRNVYWYFLAKRDDDEINNVVLNPFIRYLNGHYGAGAGHNELIPRILTARDSSSYVWVFFQVEAR